MSFRINTNVAALNAHSIGVQTNRSIANSLEKLSSGLRINKAADDASGMAIADSLRSQSESLTQAIRNANEAIGIIQIADKAMDEQLKILDTIKTKAIQAAQDGQSQESRKSLQSDIQRLMEELDNIANTTSFNGQQMLSGAFTNKEFQIGAYSNTTIKASIGSTSSDKIGHIRMETASFDGAGMLASAAGSNLTEVAFNFKAVDGVNNFELETVKISTSAGTGIGALSEVINRFSDKLGVKATYNVMATGSSPVLSGTVRGLEINGVKIGTVNDIRKNDADGKLVNAINSVKDQTGVEASLDITGRINLKSNDGRAISIHAEEDSGKVFGGGNFVGISGNNHAIIGRLTLIRTDARDIIVSGVNFSHVGFHSAQGIAEATVNLRQLRGMFSADIASASGANANIAQAELNRQGIGAGVTSLKGAMVVMDMADSARVQLDKIRADMGAVQIQLLSTINNISTTQVNVKAAESQIRDVDFAAESANFSKNNILAQSGSFALAQANAVQQNVLRLLQ
ncbi:MULTISPECIES: flagellin B [unclassified Helicobacter]|uniref:flagellin B n=1 Tax=unclassified Helicobacter TaxID=2593540 RepID=UPI000CF11422|nr:MULTISPECIES: flagellin B [unclassified Helicobacter]